MAYVIAEPCIDVLDRACVQECPVDCIYEGGRALYIHPDECVDCGACEPVCPVEAISYEHDVPAEWSEFTADNARFFAEPLPGRDAPVDSPGGAAKIGRQGIAPPRRGSPPAPMNSVPAERRRELLPFAVVGVACVIAGGLLAAVTAPAPSEQTTWAAAYLVLVAGVAQVGLGFGQAMFTAPTSPWSSRWRPSAGTSVTLPCSPARCSASSRWLTLAVCCSW